MAIDNTNNKEPVLMKSKQRVQKHGEVFTPQWVVDKMIAIPGIKERAEDIYATFLEPSAGEGAFLLAIEDIKLRHVTDNHSRDSWNTYALWALTSIYGIEFLEDNLAAARHNMLELFSKYYKTVYGTPLPKRSDLYKSARTIIWANVMQGDTLSHKNNAGEELVVSRWKRIEGNEAQVERSELAYSSLFGDEDISDYVQIGLFDKEQNGAGLQKCYAATCIELVWKEERDMSEKKPGKFKFDVVIGNPPYQEEAVGEGTHTPPIYHKFMEEAYKVANRVSFITPARFLYNAGATPKDWNKKMLEDKHLKVEYYEQDSSKVFSNTAIIGGVAVTYRDSNTDFGPIGTFTAFQELNSILKKVMGSCPDSFSSIIYNRGAYRYTDKLDADFPGARAQAQGSTEFRVESSAFDQLKQIFFDNKPDDGNTYIQLLGLQKNKRVYKWVRRDYISEHTSLTKYKVFISKSNGASGTLSDTAARMISMPLVGNPLIGSTETFLSVGAFYSKDEAKAALDYVRSKFARVLLGVLKVTQDNTSEKWKYVPLQDFTTASDIDWSKSISEIDRQLYKKYELDESEIAFIEAHVKEME
ncbi:MAG: Eco57I restriction-modification methylase domain-containing protein [Oscillospiraceae bacterium]|nr:Eco57I restriction-modification methylase domain-containing protein [Oscillospiraceae bacterium]